MSGSFARDLVFTFRSFKRRPAFYSLVMLVFALGIGVNTIIFSVVDGVVLRPLPFPEPDRLVAPWQTDVALLRSPNPGAHAFAYRYPLGYPVYQDWLEQNTVFEHFGVYKAAAFAVTGDGVAERIRGARVTHGVFAALGVPPILGRPFLPDDDQVGGPLHVVLGHGLWQRRFGSDSGVVGRTIVLDERAFTVVGVMPQEFDFPAGSEMWTTFSNAPDDLLERDNNSFLPVARLRPKVTLDQAQGELESLAAHLKDIHPIPGKDYGVNVVHLDDDIVRNVRSTLLLLQGIVGIFIVIACANIANLLLVRASERRNELAVRLSIGASRTRILRQLLTESVTCSVVGAVLGALVAATLVDPFIALLPSNTPRLSEVGVDFRVLACSAVLAVLTGVTVGALPGLGIAHARLSTVLKDAGRASAGSRYHTRTQTWVLTSQIALTFVLLVGAGLLIKSFARLTSTDRGFEAEGVVALDIYLHGSRYASQSEQRALYDELSERLEAIPGVTALAATRAGPFLSVWSQDVVVETPSGHASTSPCFDFVSGSYFRTMGIPLLAGRTFLPNERFRDSPVVIVNEAMARTFWPNEPAIGKRIFWEEAVDSNSHWLTIVGVVGNVRRRLEVEPYQTVYYPMYYGNPTIVLKAGIEPAPVMETVRAAVRAVDPDVPIVGLETLEETIDASVASPRVRTILLGVLAALAALLSVVGIFGVLAYAVAQRTSEIGIRMALGATATDIVRAVVCRALQLVGVGVAIGLAVSLVSVQALDEFLFEVNPIDPVTLFSVVILVTVTALAASAIPVRKAASVDPVDALNREHTVL